MYVSVGHDEYWSGQQRRAVTKARDAGVHLMFLSGNEAYWKVRVAIQGNMINHPYEIKEHELKYLQCEYAVHQRFQCLSAEVLSLFDGASPLSPTL